MLDVDVTRDCVGSTACPAQERWSQAACACEDGAPDAAPLEPDASPEQDASATPDSGPGVHCSQDAGPEPVILASGLDVPGDIALDAAYTYWVESGGETANGTVKRVSICGGPVATLASGQSTPAAIAVDTTNVYWVNEAYTPQATLMKVAKAGGSAQTVLAPLVGIDSIALGTGAVYLGGSLGAVTSVPLDGGSPTIVVPGNTEVTSLVVAATRVYWMDLGAGALAAAVKASPLTPSGAVTTLASGLSGATNLVADATYLYSIEVAAGFSHIVRVPLAGGPVQVIASDSPAALAVPIAIDAAHIFWARTSPSMGEVVEAPIGGGAPTVLASASGQTPVSIAVDGSNVYWSTDSSSVSSSGTIMKLAK
jgi:hypothetical protein